MFDKIFEWSDALRRQLAGPLREARLAYLRHRAEQGAAAEHYAETCSVSSGGHRTPESAAEGGLTTTQIERAADQWARRRSNTTRSKAVFHARVNRASFVSICNCSHK